MALTRVDDRSSSIIYSAGWGRGGASTDYNDSVTYATLAGQTATLTFRGIGISVFGHIMAASPGIPAPISSYSIDGGAATVLNQVQDGVEHPNQQFYQSPILSNAEHTIVVTNVLGSHAAYFLDYFVVVSGSDTPSSASPLTTVVTPVVTPAVTPRPSSAGDPSTSPTSRSTSGSKILSTTDVNGTVYTVTVVPSSGPVNPPSTSSSAMMAFSSDSPSSNLKGQTGIIIGSSIGGTAALLLLSALIVFCWFHKRRRNVSESSPHPYTSQWDQQAGRSDPFARMRTKFPPGSSQLTESPPTSQDHEVAGRPPSYSQEPPSYISGSTRPSKFGYLSSS